MKKLNHDNLYSLEEYARLRPQFRDRVMQHKRHRRLSLGQHATLYFEDVLTMQYQVQEMLRLERIFEPDAIQEELDVYNPLIPDGLNWKATFMVEYEDPAERKDALSKLIGIERQVWVQVAGFERVYAIANEDLERETADKTSAVHFLRFELTAAMASAVKRGEPVTAGISLPAYTCDVEMSASLRNALAGDLH